MSTTPRSTRRANARPRGVAVTPLDLSTYEAEALALANQHSPEKGYTKARVYDAPYALGMAPDGTTYLIGEEGVGWPLTDDNEFDVHCSTETSFNMLPSVTMHLSADEVRAAATAEPVDLADHIRVFGSRLDSNHRMWFAQLGGE